MFIEYPNTQLRRKENITSVSGAEEQLLLNIFEDLVLFLFPQESIALFPLFFELTVFLETMCGLSEEV